MEEENGRAIQILISNEDGDSFTLDGEALNSIIERTPKNVPIAVVSVVGAFRSGKSFMLDFFLRFLRFYHNTDSIILTRIGDIPNWIEHGSKVLEGSSSDPDQEKKGFSFRPGSNRNTVGMWMWSEPYVLPNPQNPREKLCILLMDTQGMFDGRTGQMLTTCIFGLSTLLSSYQLYNIDKRIQEDNLQHLALFSEYGRIIYRSDDNQRLAQGYGSLSHLFSPRLVGSESERLDPMSPTHSTPVVDGSGDGEKESLTDGGGDEMNPSSPSSKQKIFKSSKIEKSNRSSSNVVTSPMTPIEKTGLTGNKKAPFQRLDFIVRDWQNFENEEDIEQDLKEMKEYINEILSERDSPDLVETRQQINACYQQIGAFLLPHPGSHVPKKTYNGQLSLIEPTFIKLVGYFVETLFVRNLEPKFINGNKLTGEDFQAFALVYGEMFSNASLFPAARTILSATAEVNNQNAARTACELYKAKMDQKINKDIGHIPDSEFTTVHTEAKEAAVELFNKRATMGSEVLISQFFDTMMDSISIECERFKSENKLRDPMALIGPYLVPILIAIVAYLLKFSLGVVCSWSMTCQRTNDFLGMTIFFIVALLVIGNFSFVQSIAQQLVSAFRVLNKTPLASASSQ